MTGMARVAVIGEELTIQGFALAGALVLPADGHGQVSAAWRRLPSDVAVAVLTAAAARDLRGLLGDRPGVLTVVMPG